MVLADAPRGEQSLVGEGRWHPDVHDGHVRAVFGHGAQQFVRVARLADHLDARVGQQPGQARTQQHHIVGYDDAHGITTLTAAPRLSSVTVSVPPRAPTRSAASISRSRSLGAGPGAVRNTVRAAPSRRTWTFTTSVERGTAA